jgi:PPOX class probable F420-dependent enzyme
LRWVDDELQRRRIESARVARLATLRPDGRPHLVPVCFVLDEDIVYSAVDEKPKRSRDLQRLENIRMDPRVTLLIDHYEEDWARLWWMRLDGSAHVLDSGQERDRALALLAQKYDQYRLEPPAGPVVAIVVERWRAWSASPTPGGREGTP